MTTPRSPYKAQDEQKLMAAIWDPAIKDDPHAFVLFAFPWGKKGTPLELEEGPRSWQREKLLAIKKHIHENNNRALNNLLYEIFQDATVSGRGIGKSALVAWIVLWFLSTRIGSTTIVTANNESQLKTKTWAELGRWHTLAINNHWFERSALAMKPALWFEEAIKKQLKIDTGYYYAQAILWSEENPDAFAGAHNPLGMLLVFDEASGIPAPIWKVSKGFFTEEKCPDRYWFVFSNGRRNTGTFFECFHKNRNFWRRSQIDGRTVEGTDKKVYQEIIDEHGADSDEARVEVYGQFPKSGSKQFISRGIVEAAIERELVDDKYAPLLMGVDIARFGDDSTVICFRQGRNAKVIPPTKMKGADNMEVANTCAHLIQKYNPDGVFIDAGNGTGVIDRLKEMGYKVNEVWFGSKSPEEEYANFRTYMWAQMRDWLNGACVPNDQELVDDLTTPEYKFQGTSDKQRLETKEELKAKGFASPDFGDALACTFAAKVARKDLFSAKGHRKNAPTGGRSAWDYDIFGG
jgi:hypothetical protein